ncbi:hypothetical protein DVB69_05085 [Sporosarcina sp. BI001-red]|nr:hypothetical protein DVB69_05085 [Sporosarcina sp. BI001-red]
MIKHPKNPLKHPQQPNAHTRGNSTKSQTTKTRDQLIPPMPKTKTKIDWCAPLRVAITSGKPSKTRKGDQAGSQSAQASCKVIKPLANPLKQTTNVIKHLTNPLKQAEM